MFSLNRSRNTNKITETQYFVMICRFDIKFFDIRSAKYLLVRREFEFYGVSRGLVRAFRTKS